MKLAGVEAVEALECQVLDLPRVPVDVQQGEVDVTHEGRDGGVLGHSTTLSVATGTIV